MSLLSSFDSRTELLKLAKAQETLRRRQRSKAVAGRLIDFVRLMWPVVDPGEPFVDGWAIGAICEHLEAITAGQIKRLFINVPPGFSKSTTCDVYWPAWEWGPKRMPHLRYLAASYSAGLTERDNIRFRRVITSDVYSEYWGDVFGPSDTWSVIKVENNKTGWKMATSVGGIGTGERGNRVLIDDPNSVQQSESDTIRENTNRWFREVVPDRLTNQAKGVIMVIQQRTHMADVSGVIIADQLGYDHLMIPMEYDPKRHCVTSIGWSDPRTVEGELAWPQRFPQQVVDALKKDKGKYAWSGQYDQWPTPRGGGVFDPDWFRVYPEEGEEFGEDGKPLKPLHYPPFEYICVSVDTAYETKKENDWSACVVLGVWRDRGGLSRIMLMEAWHDRLEFHDLVTRIREVCSRRRVDALLIEAKASGISVAQEIGRLCEGRDWTVQPIIPKGDKLARAYAVQGLVQSGVVSAPDRAWADAVIEEMEHLGHGAHDDLADAMTQGLLYMRREGIAQMSDESADEVTRSLAYRPQTESVAQAYED